MMKEEQCWRKSGAQTLGITNFVGANNFSPQEMHVHSLRPIYWFQAAFGPGGVFLAPTLVKFTNNSIKGLKFLSHF